MMIVKGAKVRVIFNTFADQKFIDMAKASDIKNGNILRFNGELVSVEELIHRTPGNLRAFYQAKMRNVKSGKLVEYRFRTDEEVEICRVETRDYQYLYDDGDFFVVMDNASYEQFNIPKFLFGDSAKFLKDGMNVIIAFESDEPIMAQMPTSVELEIVYTEPAVKGDTSTNALKSATVETGVEIRVPMFVNQGDRVKVDTRTGDYIERVK
jgi:elongation factor P